MILFTYWCFLYHRIGSTVAVFCGMRVELQGWISMWSIWEMCKKQQTDWFPRNLSKWDCPGYRPSFQLFPHWSLAESSDTTDRHIHFPLFSIGELTQEIWSPDDDSSFWKDLYGYGVYRHTHTHTVLISPYLKIKLQTY